MPQLVTEEQLLFYCCATVQKCIMDNAHKNVFFSENILQSKYIKLYGQNFMDTHFHFCCSETDSLFPSVRSTPLYRCVQGNRNWAEKLSQMLKPAVTRMAKSKAIPIDPNIEMLNFTAKIKHVYTWQKKKKKKAVVANFPVCENCTGAEFLFKITT